MLILSGTPVGDDGGLVEEYVMPSDAFWYR